LLIPVSIKPDNIHLLKNNFMHIIPQGGYAQELYNNGASAGTDSAVSGAVLKTINNLLTAATNVPAGPDVIATDVDHKADTQKALADVQRLYDNQLAGSSSLVLLGETHNDHRDNQRALAFIGDIDNGNLNVTNVVFERGMAYPAPNNGNIIRETNLTTVAGGDFGWGLSGKQRSMVVAGYLVLLHAGGNQQDTNCDLLFYGELHRDIFKYYDYFARHTNAFYLLKEARTFFLVRSYEHVKSEV
jgi:hypothetical protein